MAITLVKADGSGLSDANVYADLTDLESYAELLGEDISSYTDEQKKSALYVGANKYIDRLHEFKGDKVQETQSMKLYTDLVTFADASKDIVEANVEAAILQLKGYLFIDSTVQSVNGEVTELSQAVDGAVSQTTKYAEGTSIRTKYNTSTIDALLAPYIQAGTGGVSLKVV